MITTMTTPSDGPISRFEVITSVQRRRRWSAAEKVRLVEEAMQPGMSVPCRTTCWHRTLAIVCLEASHDRGRACSRAGR